MRERKKNNDKLISCGKIELLNDSDEGLSPKASDVGSFETNNTLFTVKKNIESICKEMKNIILWLELITSHLPKCLPNNSNYLLSESAFKSEQITRRLRHLLYLATDIRSRDYLIKAGEQLDMSVNEYDGIVELTFPGLVPKAKSWKSSEYLIDPAYRILEQYVQSHTIQHFDECAVCFIHEYDKTLGIGRVLDYDNTEQKKLLDVVAAFFLKDDSGLNCDAYHTTVLGEKDLTRILIMRKEQFLVWLSERSKS